MGDSNQVVNWMTGRWRVQKTQNLLDKTAIRPMADHVDLFQHIPGVSLVRTFSNA